MFKERTTRWSTRIIAVSAVLTLSLAGAAFGASGPTKVTDTKDGFAFSLPSKWVLVPLNGSDISALLARATKNDTSLEKTIETQVKSAAKEGIKVFAIGPLNEKFSPNLNVGVESSKGAPKGASFFSAVNAQERTQLTQAGLGDVAIHEAKLPFAKVLEVSYALPKSVAGVAASGLQVVFEHTKHVYFLTITSLTKASDAQTLSMVASSWRWR